MKYILGTKEKMTQIFKSNGRVVPVTLVRATTVSVSQVKTVESDGYDAVQIGTDRAKREFRGVTSDVKKGDTINVSAFKEGDKVTISGVSKGKGFQGVVKRYNFKGGHRTHGNKHAERQPGSIGATGPQRVFKGQRMAGRTGSDRVTIRGLRVIKVDERSNGLYISGAIPGRRGTLIEIRG